MNNKIMARMVAVVMAVMMLGTVSFAATISADNTTIGTADDYATSQTTYTILAYAAASAEATEPAEDSDILALIQGGSVPESITIDPANIAANKTYVIVEYSGNNGSLARKSVAVADRTEEITVDITVDSTIEAGGKTYKNVAFGEHKFTKDENKTIKKVGFKVASKKNDGKEVDQAAPDTVITGGGDITFSLLIYGVPEDEEITLKPYIVY